MASQQVCLQHCSTAIQQKLAMRGLAVRVGSRTVSLCPSQSRGTPVPRLLQHGVVQCSAMGGPQTEQSSKHPFRIEGALQGLGKGSLSALGLLAAAVIFTSGPSLAADTAKVGTCLLGNCQAALAGCLADGECLENLVCLQLCNGKPDETECQIRCGDLYSDKAVSTFNACAVTEKKCVPQRVDTDVYPVPNPCALDEKFDLSMFQGRWYITAGQNPIFDIFDCQEHFFGVPEPGMLAGKINWRIPKPNSDFIERSTIQTFKQDPTTPALLSNKGNEYLHYEDDWYIIASKPDEYVFVYYKGNNDAWKGYGGAVVYTRASSLPEEYIPELKVAAEKVGMTWDQFTITDNTCPPHPPVKSLVQEVEDDFGKAEKALDREVQEIEYSLEGDLKSFGKGFTVIEKNILSELSKDEGVVESTLRKDAEQVEKAIEKEAKDVEATLEMDAKQVEAFLERIERQAKLPAWVQALPFKLPWM